MRLNQLPNVKTNTAYSRLSGGLDLVTPPLAIDAGKAISAMNYECESLGGYKRIDGYERFDGRTQPSDQRYLYANCAFIGAVSIGDTITGATSSATGKVIALTDTSITFTRVTGVFVVEDFKVSGVAKGTFSYAPSQDSSPTGLEHATALKLMADEYRLDTSAVPGSGVIRGVCMLKGVAYAWRNTIAGNVTFTDAGDVITMANHGAVNGNVISFSVITTTTGISTGVHYYVINATANTFQISSTSGGSALPLTTNGTGSLALETDIYRSTPSGWVRVTLFKSLPFKNGEMDLLPGVYINQLVTGATALVKRQINETAFTQLDLESTSVTSVIMATGAKSLTVDTGRAYAAGQALIITSAVNPINYMIGTVTSYDKVTGILIANITSIVGSGTFSNWAVHAESTNTKNYTGRLIVTDVIGTFNTTDTIRVATVPFGVPDGSLSQISIIPGGNYQFVQCNFLASTDAKRIYGTDSLNRAFEFDGDVYAPIRTQIDIDAPTCITAINDQLILSYFGQILYSAVGNPFDFKTTSLGFGDLGFGDTITGLSPQPAGVLAVFCRDSCYQVAIDPQLGNYVSKLISPDLGAIHYGLMNLGGLYTFDDRGITKIIPSYTYSNFDHDTVSRSIQPIIDRFREKIVATAIYKSKNQVRFYAADGSGICMTMGSSTSATGQTNVEHWFSQFQYPINVSYAWFGEDASGRDVILLGADNGFVYVAGKGASFDGTDIEAYVRLAFNNIKSPTAIKRFRKVEIEMTAVGYAAIRFNPDFTYASPDIATHNFKNTEVNGIGGYWDESEYNSFYYDGQIVSQPEMRIQGSGTNISLVMYSKSAIDLGHTLSGIVLHYTSRKLNR